MFSKIRISIIQNNYRINNLNIHWISQFLIFSLFLKVLPNYTCLSSKKQFTMLLIHFLVRQRWNIYTWSFRNEGFMTLLRHLRIIKSFNSSFDHPSLMSIHIDRSFFTHAFFFEVLFQKYSISISFQLTLTLKYNYKLQQPFTVYSKNVICAFLVRQTIRVRPQININ